jgi:lauroyl/myristoyl acyltransferase
LQSFPEQLPSAKWSGCCRIVGVEPLHKARCGIRPVVLAFCHFGAYDLLGFWLHASGFPVATLVGAASTSPSAFRRLKGRISHFAANPVMFFMDQLPQACEFLAAGDTLLIAIDSHSGKQMSVPFRDGWAFQMATGAIRLAMRYQAELIPCCIIDEGGWQFRVELGRPVPREYLTVGTDGLSAGKHLLEEMSVHFQACPEQCSPGLFQRFRRLSGEPAPVRLKS